MLGEKGIGFIYEFSDVLHCENIDAVSEEFINDYKIENGSFDNVRICEKEGYIVPSYWDIGKIYMRLILELGGMDIQRLIEVYNSYIAECINDYTIGFYFLNPQCIYESYKSNTMLD